MMHLFGFPRAPSCGSRIFKFPYMSLSFPFFLVVGTVYATFLPSPNLCASLPCIDIPLPSRFPRRTHGCEYGNRVDNVLLLGGIPRKVVEASTTFLFPAHYSFIHCIKEEEEERVRVRLKR